MRTTIYIPDEVFGEVKEAAWKQRKSVSRYFLDLHNLAIEKINTANKIYENLEVLMVASPNAPGEVITGGKAEKIASLKEKIPGAFVEPPPFKSYTKDVQLGRKGK